MKKLLVVDGNSIINRAFYGIRPLTTAAGEHTNAIFGMTNMILRQLKALAPDYTAVAFDVKHPTFRHNLYPEYKAGRKPTPPELLSQFPYAKEILEAMGLTTVELPGYEADDIQGTLARIAEDSDIEAYVLSGDRDLLQLISSKTTVLLAGNNETAPYDSDAFSARFGIAVSQYLDLKALMGDSSDNIPGVPGIGEKTALKLLGDYGDLDGIFQHKDDPALSPSLRRKLNEGEKSGRLSRCLVEIDRCVPLPLTLDDIRYRGFDSDKLYRLFRRFEFSEFIRRLDLHEPIPEESNAQLQFEFGTATAANETSYSPADGKTLLDFLPLRFAMESKGGKLAFSDGEHHFLTEEPLSAILPLFTRAGATVICFDGKHLLHEIHKIEPKASPVILDLSLYAYLLHAGDRTPTPESLLLTYLGLTPAEHEPITHLMPKLEAALAEAIEKLGMGQLLREVELPLLPILAEMEETGFKVDRAGLIAIGEHLTKRAEELEAEIYAAAGHEFNIQSPKQLGELLFGELGLPGGKKTKTGYSTNAEVLDSLRYAHPVVALVLEYRQITKLNSTYAVGLLAAADENDRIHTEFKQALTATGRLSSAEPNLQNIPVRTELGRLFRTLFIADPGRCLVDADYSQIELRLLAHIADDEAMQNAFLSGIDIHTTTAAEVFHLPHEMVTPEMRLNAKAVNFGIMYGIGAYSLSRDLGITTGEAKAYIESYKASYPGIADYLERVTKEAAELGRTTTLLGRIRQIPELKASNKMTQAFGRRIAMNSPIQGSSADIMKIAMVKVHDRLAAEAPSARLVMQVHDELIVECDERDADAVSAILKAEMESAMPLSIPLSVEVAVGQSWAAK